MKRALLRPACDCREARPTAAGAPESRDAAVEHHGRPISGPLKIGRLEVTLEIEPQSVEDVSGKDDQAGPRSAESDRFSLEIVDAACGAVRPNHEHPGLRIHGRKHLDVGWRSPDPGQRLMQHLASHEAKVEIAALQHRNVLGAALRVPGLDQEIRVGRSQGFNQGSAVDRKAAARRRCPQHYPCRLRHAALRACEQGGRHCGRTCAGHEPRRLSFNSASWQDDAQSKSYRRAGREPGSAHAFGRANAASISRRVRTARSFSSNSTSDHFRRCPSSMSRFSLTSCATPSGR
jgi:hypothetical protein